MEKYAKRNARPILRRQESMMTTSLSQPHGTKSMLVQTIQLVLIEMELKRINPQRIIDLTAEPAHIRYDFLKRENPSHTRHCIVVSMKGKDYFACLTVSKYGKKKTTLELIDHIPASPDMATEINYENNRIWLD